MPGVVTRSPFAAAARSGSGTGGVRRSVSARSVNSLVSNDTRSATLRRGESGTGLVSRIQTSCHRYRLVIIGTDYLRYLGILLDPRYLQYLGFRTKLYFIFRNTKKKLAFNI